MHFHLRTQRKSNASGMTYTSHELIERIQGCSDLNELQGYWKLIVEEKYEYTLIELFAFKYLISEQTAKIMKQDATEFKAFFRSIGLDLWEDSTP
jgi:hypothetical protein